MRMREDKVVQSGKRRFQRTAVSDALQPGILIEYCCGHREPLKACVLGESTSQLARTNTASGPDQKCQGHRRTDVNDPNRGSRGSLTVGQESFYLTDELRPGWIMRRKDMILTV